MPLAEKQPSRLSKIRLGRKGDPVLLLRESSVILTLIGDARAIHVCSGRHEGSRSGFARVQVTLNVASSFKSMLSSSTV
jgi:hypothetical protein